MLTPKTRSLIILVCVVLLLTFTMLPATVLALTAAGDKGCFVEYASNTLSLGQTMPVYIRNGVAPIKFSFDQGWETVRVDTISPLQVNITGLRRAQGSGGGGIAQISFTDSRGVYCGRPWIQVVDAPAHSAPINLTGYWVDRGPAQSHIIIMQEGATLVAMETYRIPNATRTWFGTGKIDGNRFGMEIYFSPEANSGVARKLSFAATIENNNSIRLEGGNNWQRIW